MTTTPTTTGSTRRLAQVDLLKGLAILAVIALHGLPLHVLTSTKSPFHIGQAVPVFVVLMALNATRSFDRRGFEHRRYWISRIDRLYVPLVIVFFASWAIAFARGDGTLRQLSGLVSGVLPLEGPGNYFVLLAFEFAVVFPLIYWLYRRAPVPTVVGAFVVAAAFELAARNMSNAYLYESCVLRFLGTIALGMVLADHRRLPRWWWAGFAVSVVYIALVVNDASTFALGIPGERHNATTFLSAFYAATLVYAGLRWLPSVARGAWRIVEQAGVASYEIFLVQIAWFALGIHRGIAAVVLDAVVCVTLGVLLHAVVRRLPSVAVVLDALRPPSRRDVALVGHEEPRGLS
jgi:peptidoglycan/LPS O-acetylase OafA/YrhL